MSGCVVVSGLWQLHSKESCVQAEGARPALLGGGILWVTRDEQVSERGPRRGESGDRQQGNVLQCERWQPTTATTTRRLLHPVATRELLDVVVVVAVAVGAVVIPRHREALHLPVEARLPLIEGLGPPEAGMIVPEGEEEAACQHTNISTMLISILGGGEEVHQLIAGDTYVEIVGEAGTGNRE